MGHQNGAKAKTGAHLAIASGGAVAVAQDPMSRVLDEGPRMPVALTAALAAVLHVALAGGAGMAGMFQEIFAWQKAIHDVVDYRLSQYEVDLVKEKEPPPPPPPEPEKPPEPEPEKPVAKEPPPPDAPPPVPAEAAKVLTAEPKPDEGPVDLTNTFVTGSGSTYAGGTTSADGTSKTAVYNPAATPKGVPGGTGTGAPQPPAHKEDKSRAPGLLGSVEWNDCPFPGEADAEQIDHSAVLIQVKVRPDGTAESVAVLQDPGHGFAREAKKCAMRKKYSQGLDVDGNPIGGTTKPFRVRFDR